MGCVNNQTSQLPSPPIDPGERECLMRAMYFESNRSSYDGLMAVGTVVMNRKETGRWGNTVCEVVGKKNQFAPGALTRKISPRESVLAERAADAVMSGERHANMDYVMYFHTAGLHFPYKNMHYRLVAGGNAFYERYPRVPKSQMQDPANMLAAGNLAQPAATAVAATQTAAAPAAQPAIATVAPVPPPGVATVPAIADASTGPSFAAAPPAAATTAPSAGDGTSPVVQQPQTQSTLAYAASPAPPAAPDQASPLFKAFAAALSDRRSPPARSTELSQPAVAGPVGGAEPAAGAQTAAASTSAPPAPAQSSPDTPAPVPR